MSRVIPAAFLCLLSAVPATRAEPKADARPILLDDFEADPKGWTYIDGREFPGAKGSLALDAAEAHGGKRSYKLQADFSGGGAYVGVWRDLGQLKGRDVNELRLWVKAVNVTSVGVRLSDDTDQIHQTKGVKLAATADWQQVVLKISDLVGGEHWGGAADGKWHGPLKAFGLNIGKDSLAAGATHGSVNIDDVEAVPGPVIDGHPTLLGRRARSAVVPPRLRQPAHLPLGRGADGTGLHRLRAFRRPRRQDGLPERPRPVDAHLGLVRPRRILQRNPGPYRRAGRRLPDHGGAVRPPRRRPRLGPPAAEDGRRV